MAKKSRLSKDAFDWVKDTSAKSVPKEADPAAPKKKRSKSPAPEKPAPKSRRSKPPEPEKPAEKSKPAAKNRRAPAEKTAEKQPETPQKVARQVSSRSPAPAATSARQLIKAPPQQGSDSGKAEMGGSQPRKSPEIQMPAGNISAEEAGGKTLLVRYRRNGDIVALAEIDAKKRSRRLTFGDVPPDQMAVKITLPGHLAEKSLLDIHSQCMVDVSGALPQLVMKPN